MIENQIFQGDHKQWRLLELLAQGDAGEVFLVESVLDRKPAVLKRPHSGNFLADITRQSAQIATEASVLKVLHQLQIPGGDFSVRIANLLDQSLPGTELTPQFFIVTEKAPGLSLPILSKVARFGLDSVPQSLLSGVPELGHLLQSVEKSKSIPDLIILRALKGVFDLLGSVHSLATQWFDGDVFGILWNDVKPDHIYWDPTEKTFTLIDWGNGQFLEKDGISRDRMYSTADDYSQLIEGMHTFLSEAAPGLLQSLDWPTEITPGEASAAGLQDLFEGVSALLSNKSAVLMEARQRENHYLASGVFTLAKLKEIDDAQQRVLNSGELPDYASSERLHQRTAALLASQAKMEEFIQVCQHAVKTILPSGDNWKVLERLAKVYLQNEGAARPQLLNAIREGINGDWLDANWSLCLACSKSSDPSIWNALSRHIRSLVPEIAQDATPPYQAVTRLVQGLEDDLSREREKIETSPQDESQTETLANFEGLVAKLKNDIVLKWTEIEPPPPGADISYSPVEDLIFELQEIFVEMGIEPNTRLGALKRALSQPQAQVAITLDTWRAKGFRTAQKGLRNLLVWDPDRVRVLRADQAIEAATIWLEDIRHGPQTGEKVSEFAIRMEYIGRDLRGRVGNAPWIEAALALFSKLRSGARPGDLIEADSNLLANYPWLKPFERKPILDRPQQTQAVQFARANLRQEKPPIKEGKLGHDLQLGDPLDTWVPEARGSSARVFRGDLLGREGRKSQAAIKIMRSDKVDYALPLFWEEAQVLSILKGIPGISGWNECGYIRLQQYQPLPSESTAGTAQALSGDLIRYGVLEANTFMDELTARAEAGWLPYLALEIRNQSECLLQQCDEGYTKGQYLPVELGVQIAVQICAVLESAHAKNVVYRDHKILHYYWDPLQKEVSVIDWNVAKWHSEGLSETEKHLDLVQLGARALHHLFAGRPAPGALPVGPTRPDEVDMAPQSYSVAWTYDDKQRLSPDLRNILSELLAGSYDSAGKLREDLLLQLSYAEQSRRV
jgi:serine/threonine protein kinase